MLIVDIAAYKLPKSYHKCLFLILSGKPAVENAILVCSAGNRDTVWFRSINTSTHMHALPQPAQQTPLCAFNSIGHQKEAPLIENPSRYEA